MADYGLGSTGATLAARYPAQPHIILTNAPGFAGNTKQMWFIPPANSQLRWEVFSVGFPAILGNFPYGEPVEPDVPL